MIQCQHCSACKQYFDDYFCYLTMKPDSMTKTTYSFKFTKLPTGIMNSEPDTPEWCPRGLK